MTSVCLTCGCHLPNNTHDDDRHIVLSELKAAANAAGISVAEAANNLTDTVADMIVSALPDNSR